MCYRNWVTRKCSGNSTPDLDTGAWFSTTFNTPFGRYCFKRLPFGLVSAQDIFQRDIRWIARNYLHIRQHSSLWSGWQDTRQKPHLHDGENQGTGSISELWHITSSKTASASMDTSWQVKELSRTHKRFPLSKTWSHPRTLSSCYCFSPQPNSRVHWPQICQISVHHTSNSLGKTFISSEDLNTRRPLNTSKTISPLLQFLPTLIRPSW